MKIISVFLCLISHICFAANQIETNQPVVNIIQEQPKAFEELSIVVFSCDKYQELWAPFFEMFFKCWPTLKTTNNHIPIYLVTNSQTYNDSRIVCLKNENEKSWSDNALTVLATIKTKYVLVILEDYFFSRIDENRLLQIFNYMKTSDVAYCQIANDHVDANIRKKHEVAPGIAEKDRYEPWRTSLYPCIWRTKDMMHIVKSGESIWEFEIPGTQRSQGLFGKFLTVFEKQPVDYLNMVQMGYLNSKNLNTVIEMGITYKRGKLELDSDHKLYLWYKNDFKQFLYYRIWTPIKEFIKEYVF